MMRVYKKYLITIMSTDLRTCDHYETKDVIWMDIQLAFICTNTGPLVAAPQSRMRVADRYGKPF